MKAITFIGTGKYQSVKYRIDDRVVESDLFPIALCGFFHPQKMTVFVTEESKKAHWPKLSQELQGKIELSPVTIPWGKTEDDLWTIFARVVESVDDGEEVVFDITHGFRSLPFVVFLAVAYLRHAKKINVKAVVYGAFDARDNENQAPVFDLSPFLSLLDWLTAAHLFRASGSAAELSKLLKDIQSGAHRNPLCPDPPRRLQNIGRQIERLSQSLLLIRPLGVMENAEILGKSFTEDVAREAGRWAKPFALIAPLIQKELSRFAVAPDVGNIETQRRMIMWYVERGLYVQALTLVRELLVTIVCSQLDMQDLRARKTREIGERLLNFAVWEILPESEKCRKPWDKENIDESHVARFRAMKNTNNLVDMWNLIRENRNDVDHAGMNEHPFDADTIVRNVGKITDQLNAYLGNEQRTTSYSGPTLIDLSAMYSETAKVSETPHYVANALESAQGCHEVVLTGQAPIWLYLKIAHALHGKIRKLSYRSPVTGDVEVFDHNPF